MDRRRNENVFCRVVIYLNWVGNRMGQERGERVGNSLGGELQLNKKSYTKHKTIQNKHGQKNEIVYFFCFRMRNQSNYMKHIIRGAGISPISF